MSFEKQKQKLRNIELVKKEMEQVPQELRDQVLQTSMYNISKTHPFLGSLLQCMDIVYTHMLPTAAIGFDAENKRWLMRINPFFFAKLLPNEKAQQAILLHEIHHVTHKHPMRIPFVKLSPARMRLMNVAADMAINQFIPSLPDGCALCKDLDIDTPCPTSTNIEQGKLPTCPGKCIDIKYYFDEHDGKQTPWPENQTMEYYYHRLLERYQESYDENQCPNCGCSMDSSDSDGNDSQQSGSSDSDGNDSQQKDSSDSKGDGNKQSGSSNSESNTGQTCPNCGHNPSNGLPQTIDEHDWHANVDENEMLEATEDLVKRAMQKQSLSYDKLPNFAKQLLDDIDARRSALNYRGMILAAIKRSASGHDRKHTWTRKSRRFGNFAPGTKVSDLPMLHLFLDTSGSISVQEANDFLDIIDNFLRAGHRKCMVSLWHTSVYKTFQYKLGQRFDKKDFQIGGTCLNDTMKTIAQKRPDLSIILTDGGYCDVQFEAMVPASVPFPQTLFIISREGHQDHPLKRLGTTIKIPNADVYKKDDQF